MQKVRMESFQVIGIAIKTSNENERSLQDIQQLWGRFISENILAAIPNKLDQTIYSIYSNYESDHTKPFDTILACKVSSLHTIPEGMVGLTIPASDYAEFRVKGDLTKGLVANSWLKIWEENIDRAFTADFEVYDHRATDPNNAEVGIFVALNNG